MFESATVRNPGKHGAGFDIGRLLDAMLYYDRVNLILDPFSFTSVVSQLGFPDAKALLSHPTLVTSVVPELPVVHTEKRNSIETHQPTFIQFAGREGREIKHGDVLSQTHHSMGNQEEFEGEKRSQVERTLRRAKKTSLQKLFGDSFANKMLQSLLEDPATYKLFIRGLAQRLCWKLDGAALDRLRIEIVTAGSKTLVSSEPALDTLFGGEKLTTWAAIINLIHDYAIELYMAQALSSDFIGNPDSAEIADARIDLSLQRASKSAARVEAFEEAVFDEAKLFGEAFNEGRLTIGGALNLVDRSRPMREWMKGLPLNADILRKYQAELAKEPLFKSIPASIARFALFSGVAAMLTPAAGLGLSAFDALIVDRIAGGWRPSVFVKIVREFIPVRDE